MKKYEKCEKCGSYFLKVEERIAPIQHSCLDSIGRAILLLIPIIGWAVLLSRKNFIKETFATCTQCGYRKDLTKRTSLFTKIVTVWVIIAALFFVFVFIMAMHELGII